VLTQVTGLCFVVSGCFGLFRVARGGRSSLHEAVMNHRSEERMARDAGGDALPAVRMFSDAQEKQLTRILEACNAPVVVGDAPSAAAAYGGMGGSNNEVMDLAGLLLEDHPDSEPLLSLLLGPAASTESVATANGVAVYFSEATWVRVVLPFARGRLGEMGEVRGCHLC